MSEQETIKRLQVMADSSLTRWNECKELSMALGRECENSFKEILSLSASADELEELLEEAYHILIEHGYEGEFMKKLDYIFLGNKEAENES